MTQCTGDTGRLYTEANRSELSGKARERERESLLREQLSSWKVKHTHTLTDLKRGKQFFLAFFRKPAKQKQSKTKQLAIDSL